MKICEPRSGLQILIEKVEASLPGQFRGRLIVSRRRVVVETVIRALVYIRGIGHVIGLERFLPGRKSTGDARVEGTVMKQERRLDFSRVIGRGLPAVIGN